MLLLCRCRRPPICNASRKKLFEPAGLTQEFRILCWFLETNAGFQNSARDFENSCWVSKTDTGFENPAPDFENSRLFSKTNTSEASIYRRDGNAELAPSRKLKPSNARWMKS